MIWLDGNGEGLYFDIHHAELRNGRAGEVMALSGTIGDGALETEILVEAGDRVTVTFADEWLAPSALQHFFSRVSRGAVEQALEGAVEGFSFGFREPASPRGRGTRRDFRWREEETLYGDAARAV